MKILVVCGAGRLFGKERVILSLMEGLRNRGHEVMCLTSTWKDGKFEKRLQELSIPYRLAPLGFVSKTLSSSAFKMSFAQLCKLPALWRVYRKTIRSFQPNVVLHSAVHHLTLLLPVLGQARHVFHVHDAFEPTTFYRRLFKLLAKRITVFVGVSRFVADSLAQLGIPTTNLRCVLNGIALDNPIGLKTEATDHSDCLTAKNGTIKIGIVGQIDEWKGHEDLIEALRILQEKQEAFVCRIFGSGSFEFSAKLKARIAEYRLTDRVEWMGFVDEQTTIYNKIDVCVVPSRLPEAFGMVAAEALINGLPVVASRKGGLTEVIQHGRNGYLVDAESPEQIAEKIRMLISPAKRVEMGQSAREFVSTLLSAERMIDEMEGLLKSLDIQNTQERGE